LKTYLRRIHLILAFTSGLFLINLSISGALLIYGKEIQKNINPQYWLLPVNKNQINPPLLTLSVLTQIIERATQKKIQFIQPAENQYDAWQVRLMDKSYLSINPYNADILLAYDFTDSFYGFVMSWHRWLLYTNDANERPMQLWVSMASVVFILELILGFTLWVRPKNRLKRLQVRWKAKNKVRFMQLHCTVGVIFCLPLILISFSGIAFFWQAETKQVVEWLSFSKVQRHNFQDQQQHQPLISQEELHLDKAYQVASASLAPGSVYRIYLPNAKSSVLALRIKMPDESHANSWSWADPYSGTFLNSFDASKTSLATQVWNFKYKFHIGDFIGWPVKILWLFVSLMPCFFVLSGIYLWIKRKQKLGAKR
jgi:uncharacterized iron-regulated membrane protein